MTTSTTESRARVLVVGERVTSRALMERLKRVGYACAAVDGPDNLLVTAAKLRPDAVLFTSAGKLEQETLNLIRQDTSLQKLPVLGALTPAAVAGGLRSWGLDDWIHAEDELALRIDASLKTKHLAERDAHSRLKLEMLLDITQAATSSLEVEQVLNIAVEKISRVIEADRCSVVLVEGSSPRNAYVVASRGVPGFSPLKLDLARYPEVRRSLETRQPICVEDAARDPLMEEVRPQILPLGVKSILVQPLICQEDLLGAIFLRLSKADGAFGNEEQEFARAVAAALANSVRNARLHTALKKKREDLESAYVDRYRELTDANRRLKEANRLKDDLIAMLSHDLRAPLQILLGHARLLADTTLTQDQRVSSDAVAKQGKKILDLIESLLEKSKGERDRISLDPSLVDISELCADEAKALGILGAARKIRVRAEAPESLSVVGDEVKLGQVLQNLIGNAIHHAKEGGEVVVRVQRLRRPDGEAARIHVEDDGPGIPKEQLHLVFDRFHHGPGGVGLGLAICREFVELHGGEIWAEAPEKGGAAVVFTLPLAKEMSASAPAATVRGEEPRILVVEDEPSVAALVTEVLRSRYRVEIARDGAEGLAKARAMHPDLIVMDVFLPKVDGLDAAVSLKSSSDTADIPVILLSAHQGVADKVRALRLGAVDYMTKPFQALDLLSRADRALRLRAAERELERSRALLRRSGNDPETGLYDRAGIIERLRQEVSRRRRYARPLCLAMVRPQGPLLDKTREAAEFVRQKLRGADVVAHLGQGTFALLLPEASAESARMVLARILPDLGAAIGLPFRSVTADVPEDVQDLEALLDAVAGQLSS